MDKGTKLEPKVKFEGSFEELIQVLVKPKKKKRPRNKK